MRSASSVLTYVGLGLVVAGFGLIGLAWNASATRDVVAFQVPYLVSGGFTGLGLIMVGATAINVNVKRQEGEIRRRQLERLVEVLGNATRDLPPRGDAFRNSSEDGSAEPTYDKDESPSEAGSSWEHG